jgi:hypothetical protein
VVNILVENFGLQPIGEAKADIQAALKMAS